MTPVAGPVASTSLVAEESSAAAPDSSATDEAVEMPAAASDNPATAAVVSNDPAPAELSSKLERARAVAGRRGKSVLSEICILSVI